MPLSTKITLIISAIIFVIMGGFIIYKEHTTAAQMQAISQAMTSQQQLADNITRSLSTYATKDDFTAFAKDNAVNLNVIQQNLKTLGASLVAINKAAVDSSGEVANNLPSTSTTPNPNPLPQPTVNCNGKPIPCPNNDPYGYTKNVQNLHLDEEFANNDNVPIGNISFDASNVKPWSVNVLPREYVAVTTLGVDENQKYTAYNNFSINVGGKNYPITITNAKLMYQNPPNKFYFNPHLFITTGGGIDVGHLPLIAGSFNVGGMIGIFSYGSSKVKPILSILQVGAGYQSNKNEFTAIVNPINFNIGTIIPGNLISNTYIGPSFQITPSGSIYLGANLSLGF